jgi:hypothetical protein
MALKRMTPASKAVGKKVTTKKAAAKKGAKPLTKTHTTRVSVADYLSGLESEQRREEGKALVKIFEKATGWKSQMWGPSIIGYGRYSYVYESGHHGDACVVGFSPRKGAVVLYLGSGTPEAKALLAKLGKLKTDGGCIYVNKLADIDLAGLEKYVKVAQAASLKAYKERGWPVTAS